MSVAAVVFGVGSGLAAVAGGAVVDDLCAGIGLSISGRGGGCSGALCVGGAVVAGRGTRLGLR
ncbi:hypothetical protein OFM39_30095, partial [Escherichia coli]|nr:hypothetical protein [Escherichia coli]